MTEVLEQLRSYGKVIIDIIYIVLIGGFLIYALQKITKRFLNPDLKQKKPFQIVFGSLYTLIFVLTVLLALSVLGFAIGEIAELAILIVFIIGVAFFLISPYLPKLPFRLGHLIEVNGVFGTVESISAYHTCIRKFNGSIIFLPNHIILGSKIGNYSLEPSLRIGLEISVETSSDLEKALSLMLRLMQEESRVLEDPTPPFVEVINVQASGIDVKANCWVNNEDYIDTRTDLLRRIVCEFNIEKDIALSLPLQEILLTHREGRDMMPESAS